MEPSTDEEASILNVGKRIQSLRRARGMSQEALAEQIGITRQTISKWELGVSQS